MTDLIKDGLDKPRNDNGAYQRDRKPGNFSGLRLSLATAEQILSWSHGEVLKPETLNYRTLKPEKDGLFCERIFGPVKDWECTCGKYKRVHYRGKICERCGVEVTRSRVRRERMGHVTLATPVAHIWFSKGAPSRLGLLLDIVQSELDRVVYFAQHIVTRVNDEARQQVFKEMEQNHETNVKELEERLSLVKEQGQEKEVLKEELALMKAKESEPNFPSDYSVMDKLKFIYDIHKEDLTKEYEAAREELLSFKVANLISEKDYRRVCDTYGDQLIEANMGAEAIGQVLKQMDFEGELLRLSQEFKQTSGQRHRRVVKRMRLIKSLVNSGAKHNDAMIIKVLPVSPPDLRPMVQIGGMRFASSSLNDLYRRVIGRNNRLNYLLKIQAPEIMIRNEKRMLQEAVDVLIDNSRRQSQGQNTQTQTLRSLTDLMRGKQGRFRQNLLGKRVDYSGRAVIISGPNLKFDQCGLPKQMALELFKPFVINILIRQGHAQNIKSARRTIDDHDPLAWDALEEAIKDHPILLNRAPTLHRLGIQAFFPVLIEGSAIRLHPLVCTAFNADFDGDQMAVHVPLSFEARQEARQLMVSSKNILALRSGTPIMLPTLDMVLGIYYMTSIDEDRFGEGEMRRFSSFTDVCRAHNLDVIGLRQLVKVRGIGGEYIETTAGRIIFSQELLLDDEQLTDENFHNVVCDRRKLETITSDYFEKHGSERTAKVLDRIKKVGFQYATKSGTTIAMHDIKTPATKNSLLASAERSIKKLEDTYSMGMMTEDELEQATIAVWMDISDKMTEAVKKNMRNYGGIYTMSHSGAKGNLTQIKQMVGMRGLMSDPKGRIIKLPIKSSLAEGLSVFEYFISTHGARKGLADTALRTADSGYLTRRLVDVAQEVIVLQEDCGDTIGTRITSDTTNSAVTLNLSERIRSRYTVSHVVHPKTGEVLAEPGDIIMNSKAQEIEAAGVTEVVARTPFGCQAKRGICSKCYGTSLGNNKPSIIGEAVGIIAAQSIGEPGTQLTMRTFHTGGVVGQDITAGLPRVVEIFEARKPKGEAVTSEIDGKVKIEERDEGIFATVSKLDRYTTEIRIPENYKAVVKSGTKVDSGDEILAPRQSVSKKENLEPIKIDVRGTVKVTRTTIIITSEEADVRTYQIPVNAEIKVTDGETIKAGQPLTSGALNPHDLLRTLGVGATERYLVNEIQAVYRSQGVEIHDKHIEVIIRQMLRKVRVTRSGDTEFLHGEIIERSQYARVNQKVATSGGEAAQATSILMGVTRASLLTDSFLAAASFQETSRILTNAALSGATDVLRGLKESVIIGRLIPARLDLSDEGRKRLAWSEVEKYNQEKRLIARERAMALAAQKAEADMRDGKIPAAPVDFSINRDLSDTHYDSNEEIVLDDAALAPGTADEPPFTPRDEELPLPNIKNDTDEE